MPLLCRAVILGGRSGEHEVSVNSARNVIAALDPDRWEPAPIAITRRGDWISNADTTRALARGFDCGLNSPVEESTCIL